MLKARRMQMGVAALAVIALGGCGGSHQAKPQQTAHKIDGEINLTTLTADQMKPLSARVSRDSVKLHPRLVKVAGVSDDGFTAADQPAASSAGNAPSNSDVERQLAAFRRYLRSTPGVPVGKAAAVLPDGTAVAPLSAPAVVAA